MNISIERADAPGVLELLQLSDDFHAALYPQEGNYLLDVSELSRPEVTVIVARENTTAVGMGAIVLKNGYAELKRMFIRPDSRGTGLADQLLQSLEAAARDLGVQRLQLETGALQPAAIAFYERNGFERINIFGEYVGGEHSICFAKALAI